MNSLARRTTPWHESDRCIGFRSREMPSLPLAAVRIPPGVGGLARIRAKPKVVSISVRAACVAVLLVLATGCAGIRPTLKPEQVALVNQTDVQSYLPQAEVDAQYIQSGYGAGGGLIGAIVDASVSAGRAKNANERVQRLRDQVRDVDFRALYWEAVSNAVGQTAWFKMEHFVPLALNVEKVTKSRVAQGAALNVGTDYLVSQDCRVFVVTTGLGFYLPGKHRKPAAANVMVYHSAEVGEPDGDEAIDLWVANGGERFRKTVMEAIQESAKLVRHALDLMGGSSTAVPRPAKISAHLLHARGDFGIASGHQTLKGDILEETADRVIFRLKTGQLYSFPRNELNVQYLSAK